MLRLAYIMATEFLTQKEVFALHIVTLQKGKNNLSHFLSHDKRNNTLHLRALTYSHFLKPTLK